MAHPGRARVNAISTALPDSQLRLGGEREKGREMWSAGGRGAEIETVCLEDTSVRGRGRAEDGKRREECRRRRWKR